MRKRAIEKHFFFSEIEAIELQRKSKKTGLSESAYVRSLISGTNPREKPDDRFYQAMRELSAIGNNLHQIARKANALGFIDAPLYQAVSKQLQDFQLEVRMKFLLPEKLE